MRGVPNLFLGLLVLVLAMIKIFQELGIDPEVGISCDGVLVL